MGIFSLSFYLVLFLPSFVPRSIFTRDRKSVVVAGGLRWSGARAVRAASRLTTWWCGPASTSTTSAASPAPRATRRSPPATTSAWRTIWFTVEITTSSSCKGTSCLRMLSLHPTCLPAPRTRKSLSTTASAPRRKDGPGRESLRCRIRTLASVSTPVRTIYFYFLCSFWEKEKSRIFFGMNNLLSERRPTFHDCMSLSDTKSCNAQLARKRGPFAKSPLVLFLSSTA